MLHYVTIVMAAHVDAATSSSFKLRSIFVLIFFFTFITETHITYDINILIGVEKRRVWIKGS